MQPSLLSPAAGGVRVHLPGCHPYIKTVIHMLARQVQLFNCDDYETELSLQSTEIKKLLIESETWKDVQIKM